VATGIPCR